MILALIIALPFMGALLPLLAERGGRTLCAASAGVAPLIGLILFVFAELFRQATKYKEENDMTI